MASFNKVILMGHLTRDPQLRTLPNSDTPVCDFALAVNRAWKDPNGQDRKEVLFIDCTAFGKMGQTLAQSLAKGRPVHIEGRLKLETWQKDGQRRSRIRVIVEQFRFVDPKPTADPPAQSDASGQQPRNRKSAAAAQTEAAATAVDAPF